MLRTASSLPQTGLLTLGSDPARFQTKPPACYRASWQLPGPDFHRQATTSLRTRRNTMALRHGAPPVLLGARKGLSRCRMNLEDRDWHRAAHETPESAIALLSQSKQDSGRVQASDVVADGAGLGAAADEDAAF